MKYIIALISFIATLVSSYLLYAESFTLTALLAFLSSLVTFLGSITYIKKKSKNNNKNSVNQVIGNNSSGIQIGGSVNINSIPKDK